MYAGAVVVHQFCHVGYFSFIGGGSVMTQDVPKYMMVAGERAVLRGLETKLPWRMILQETKSTKENDTPRNLISQRE
ncbi:hypothetical protein ACFX2J_008287 [Malus domestica]